MLMPESVYIRKIISMFMAQLLSDLIDYREAGESLPSITVERAELKPAEIDWLPKSHGVWQSFKFLAEDLDDRIGTLYINDDTGVYIYAPITG